MLLLIKTGNSGSKRTVKYLRNNKSCELRNNKSCEIRLNKAVRKTIHREWEQETIKAALPIKYK
jgi:hypothetical protein